MKDWVFFWSHRRLSSRLWTVIILRCHFAPVKGVVKVELRRNTEMSAMSGYSLQEQREVEILGNRE